MKRIFLTGFCLLSLVVFASYSFGQTMPGGMTNQPGMMGRGMMERGQMMGDMMGMAHQMSGMMEQMSGMMKTTPASRTKAMSGIMRDMSYQMLEMSKVMHRGHASAKEMERLHYRMNRLQKRMSEMMIKK